MAKVYQPGYGKSCALIEIRPSSLLLVLKKGWPLVNGDARVQPPTRSRMMKAMRSLFVVLGAPWSLATTTTTAKSQSLTSAVFAYALGLVTSDSGIAVVSPALCQKQAPW
ncbi:hypothetical protein BV22DRAFT_80265 [Leucogyrophana mollusca]|uniref:Uncharacterized protein n=1 Tax=Leucogyrophana mollusca TaxID=85980 RepID=A0ACB8BYN1_9AGAM|nr:hypothetical protein BV22DRAFT_80265 [Leucogyrophana mollusca]